MKPLTLPRLPIPWTPNGAIFSPDREHRYLLWRVWDSSLPPIAFIGLNPSTADEIINDRTVSRCIDYAHRWGAGGLLMLNIFGYRSTYPKDLYTHPEPIGSEMDAYLLATIEQVPLVVSACGTHGKYLDRWQQVMSLLQAHCTYLQQQGKPVPKLCYLDRNQDGTPKHPLYQKADRLPIEF